MLSIEAGTANLIFGATSITYGRNEQVRSNAHAPPICPSFVARLGRSGFVRAFCSGLGYHDAGKGVGYASAIGEFCYAILSEKVRFDGHMRDMALKEILGLEDLDTPWAKAFAKVAKHQLEIGEVPMRF